MREGGDDRLGRRRLGPTPAIRRPRPGQPRPRLSVAPAGVRCSSASAPAGSASARRNTTCCTAQAWSKCGRARAGQRHSEPLLFQNKMTTFARPKKRRTRTSPVPIVPPPRVSDRTAASRRRLSNQGLVCGIGQSVRAPFPLHLHKPTTRREAVCGSGCRCARRFARAPSSGSRSWAVWRPALFARLCDGRDGGSRAMAGRGAVADLAAAADRHDRRGLVHQPVRAVKRRAAAFPR